MNTIQTTVVGIGGSKALEQAGWIVHWFHDINDPSHAHAQNESSSLSHHSHIYTNVLVPAPKTEHEWLGCHARSAAKQFESADEGIAEWETVTGAFAGEVGCNCCGEPHNFQYRDESGNLQFTSVHVTGSEISW